MASIKKVQKNVKKPKALIDVSQKQHICVVSDVPEMTDEDYALVMKKVADSIDAVRATYFSNDAAMERILSRNFRDISYARLFQVLSNHKAAKEKISKH